jgi:hypothetical protein
METNGERLGKRGWLNGRQQKKEVVVGEKE